ncbi:MAG: hypothetical protein K0Q94_2116 [Paenibacillus sp.]|jgi:hypothetical protein|nr:hypothetical protein [Paenibacillus sp.]
MLRSADKPAEFCISPESRVPKAFSALHKYCEAHQILFVVPGQRRTL